MTGQPIIDVGLVNLAVEGALLQGILGQKRGLWLDALDLVKAGAWRSRPVEVADELGPDVEFVLELGDGDQWAEVAVVHRVDLGIPRLHLGAVRGLVELGTLMGLSGTAPDTAEGLDG